MTSSSPVRPIHSQSTMRPPQAALFPGRRSPLLRLARLACAALLIRAGSSLADTPVDPMLGSQLRAAQPGARLVAGGLSLEDGTPLRLELTRFEVFSPGARIEEHGAGGSVRLVPLPDDRYFRGSVAGDPDSIVVLTAGPDTLRGLVATRGAVFTVGPRKESPLDASSSSGPIVLARLGADGSGAGGGFRCGNDAVPAGLARAAASGGASGQAAPLSSTTFDVKVALETDYELYQLFGSSVTLSSYLASLVATASAIYLRDINTTISIPSMSLWSTPADPWSATDPLSALYEVGDYWHSNRPQATYPRSTVHFIGHKGPLAGVAWIGVLCSSDFNAGGGHYGGAYGVTLGALGQFSTSNTSLYWDILAFTHEVGHNFNSPHTHCYSPPVDHCYNQEGGCYSGSVSVPPEKGTIMSYCHLVAPAYSNNIVFYLGKPAEASQAVTARMRSYVESVSACLTAAPASSPLRLYTLSPCRLADTRGATGPLGGPALQAASTRAFGLAGVCGVPGGAKAVSLNVTVTQPGGAGNVRLYPGDGALPGTSSLNFAPGQTRANNVVIPVSADGLARVAVRNDCPGTVHLILDVNGYFQ